MPALVELRRDEDVRTRQCPRLSVPADPDFVPVVLRGVDQAIPRLERGGDCAFGRRVVQGRRSQTEARHRGAAFQRHVGG